MFPRGLSFCTFNRRFLNNARLSGDWDIVGTQHIAVIMISGVLHLEHRVIHETDGLVSFAIGIFFHSISTGGDFMFQGMFGNVQETVLVVTAGATE